MTHCQGKRGVVRMGYMHTSKTVQIHARHVLPKGAQHDAGDATIGMGLGAHQCC